MVCNVTHNKKERNESMITIVALWNLWTTVRVVATTTMHLPQNTVESLGLPVGFS